MLSRTKNFVRAIDGVSLAVKRGETFGLVGESGCGKTTLGRTIMRLTEPSKGSITFDGEDISRLRGKSLRLVRRKMQMVFQDPYASLDPRQSVRSALTEPMKIHRIVSSKRDETNALKSSLRWLASTLITWLGSPTNFRVGKGSGLQ